MEKSLKAIKDCAVIILAAGHSGRMGTLKPFLRFKDNITFLEKTIIEYEMFSCKKIIIVLNQQVLNDYVSRNLDFMKGYTVALNQHVDYDRFYSIKLGMEHLNGTMPCFIQNVDNPFVNQEILSAMFDKVPESGYVSPVFESTGGHPVLLAKKTIVQVKNVTVNSLNFKHYLSGFECTKLKVNDPNILVNINTPQDYRNYFPQIQKVR